MSWFFIAIISPFLYAATNFIDKILLEKYFKQSGVGTIILFSSLLSIIAIPVSFWMDPSVLDVSWGNILVLCVVGILNVLLLWFYLQALRGEETSIVIVFYQLVPVLGYILGYFILGETLTLTQVVAMAIVIFGTTIISLEVDADNKFKLRKRTILLMLAACLCWATSSVIFKAAALEENVWRSFFWENVMLVVVGVIIFIFIRSYRNHFVLAIKNNSKQILLLNGVNELIFISGNLIISFAYTLAPVALVLLVNSFQTIFVLVIGVVLTIFLPGIVVEKIQVKHIGQKILAILITALGTFLLTK